jgi:ribosomal protein L40E
VTAPTAAAPNLTHPCVRCGAPVPLDVGLCERCNPLGLRDSSASQVHGIAVAGVATAIVILAVVGRLAISGIGPFESRIVSAVPDAGGLTLTVQVTNRGTSPGQTTCRVSDPADRNGGRGSFLLSPQVPPGGTLSFDKRVTELGTTVRSFAIECSAP